MLVWAAECDLTSIHKGNREKGSLERRDQILTWMSELPVGLPRYPSRELCDWDSGGKS